MRTKLALFALVVVAAVLRGIVASRRSFGFDEATAWKLTTFDWRDLVRLARLDVHPPLYWLVLQVYSSAFGDRTIVLRLLSIVFGLLQVVLMYRICSYDLKCDADELTSSGPRSKFAGLVGSLLVAINPTLVMSSAEARMYSLGVLLSLWHFYALLKYVGPGRLSDGVSMVLSGAALLYVHYHGIFLIATFMCVFPLLSFGHKEGRAGRARRGLLIYGAIGLLFTPWLAGLSRQTLRMQSQTYWTRPPGPGEIWNLSRYVIDFWYSPRAHIGTGVAGVDNLLFDSEVAFMALSSLLIASLAILGRKDRVQVASLLLLTCPIALACGVGTLFSLPVAYPRCFQFALVFSCVGLARSAARTRQVSVPSVVGFALMVSVLYANYQFMTQIPDGLQDCVSVLDDDGRDGSKIYCNSTYVYLPLKHGAVSRRCYLANLPNPVHMWPFVITPPEVRGPSLADGEIWTVEAAGKARAIDVDPRFVLVDSYVFFDYVPQRITLKKYTGRRQAGG